MPETRADREKRYHLNEPVPGGSRFWMISDRVLDFEVLTVSDLVPNAERIARWNYEFILSGAFYQNVRQS